MAEEVQEPKSKKNGALIAIIALVAIIAVAVFAYSALPGLRASEAYELSTAEAATSSKLLACEVENNDGDKMTLGDIQSKTGKPIVVNIWASWCTHCDVEMPYYQQLYEEYSDRVEFVMLDLNDTDNEPTLAREYVQKGGYTFPIYFDVDSQVATALAIMGVPTNVIVNANGEMVMVRSGEITYDAMKATLDKVLNS